MTIKKIVWSGVGLLNFFFGGGGGEHFLPRVSGFSFPKSMVAEGAGGGEVVNSF